MCTCCKSKQHNERVKSTLEYQMGNSIDTVMQHLLLVSWKGLQTIDGLQSLQSLRQPLPDGDVVMYAWA